MEQKEGYTRENILWTMLLEPVWLKNCTLQEKTYK